MKLVLYTSFAVNPASQDRAGHPADPFQRRRRIFVPRSRTYRSPCSGSWATGCSMLCGLPRPTIRERCARRLNTFAPVPKLEMLKPSLPSSQSAQTSFLHDKRERPDLLERALICPPHSQTGPSLRAERQQIIRRLGGSSACTKKYRQPRIGLRTTQGQSPGFAGSRSRTDQTQPDKPMGMDLPPRQGYPQVGGGGRRGELGGGCHDEERLGDPSEALGRQIPGCCGRLSRRSGRR